MLNAEKKTCKYNEQLCKYYEQFRVYADRILALSNDSLEKTVNVALALCLVCAVLVSIATVALRPLQGYNKALDMKKNILDVAGLLEEGTDIDKAFAERIESKIVDLKTGDYVDNINVDEYDQRKAAKDPAQNELIPVEKDIASIRQKAKYTKVFLVKNGDQLQSIILPINGYGLWSTMYGFLALEADAQTVQSINLYDQGETPGLGGEVVNPNWRALWKGKKVYSDKGEVALTLVKGGVDSSRPDSVYKVDGLAGATLTSRGVSNLIQYWMGTEGFATYLNKIRKNG
ncbi:Na(+)-translocating NADH-quinone reductase subunit C [Methylomonas sp. BW4-1]|uniref:Na(+)-translocating NADH-quinone reductase subunit C n=1 Tax=Methylomonas defluvii TaxID=3045149 RepID=A0ABU4UEA2_9GAMM|nr:MULTISPECIES: Na(+)-translocating NADH-quinone reductase subunit C [unclassified Methylomonas]MDX8127728.1 Na(+)-translocating NADH-quinone reductase subunit C [Methylomonas sp. OY6]NOV29108.1 Na(+)-translocating NADH-quinone reductase subunit C [Methylomonas sp. ZR1]PKD40386.1 NADH:ubiquinone reductase (Na(+)-transporting) subunit C [Methylomonas sp. Kb3]QBC27922.1 Na(+)-translocating NADH-quinone reductase subunit C [Methylomonas sp. LW13]